jgi:PAS domain S-box-containing protein
MYKPLVKERLKQPYNTIFNGLTESLNELNQLNNSLFEKNKELEDTKSKLENSIRVYKDFFEITPIPLIIRQKDIIFFINSKTKELFKLKDKEDIIGSSVFNLLEDGYKDDVRDRITRETKEKIVPAIKGKFTCFDGSTIDIEISVISILINGEEYFMDILKDISHINKLKDIELKLREKSQEEVIRNEFFANISHELRSPINVIYCAIQLDEMYLSKEDYESTRKNCKVIKQNCMRLLG